MKNACIVLHNYRNVPDPAMTNGIVGAFLSGGYCFDRLEFLPRNDIGAFKQAVAEAKSFFDNLVVVAEPELYSALRDQMELCYNTSFLTQAILDAGQKVAVLLPCGGAGERIAREDAVPFLERKYRERCDRMVVRAVAVPSDMLDAALREARSVSGDELIYNVTESYRDLRIEIIYNINTRKVTVDDVMRIFAVRLADYIYALEDITLAERLMQALRVRKMNISVAESFTGGGIAKRLVEVPGISSVFYEGVTAYANGAKQDRLGVSPYTLKSSGAVSDDAVYEMALGLINTGKCDLAIATTGIAGPKSDGTQKPVGLCYIGIGMRERIFVYKFQLAGDRRTVTETAINHALFLAYKQIK